MFSEKRNDVIFWASVQYQWKHYNCTSQYCIQTPRVGAVRAGDVAASPNNIWGGGKNWLDSSKFG